MGYIIVKAKTDFCDEVHYAEKNHGKKLQVL